MAEKEVGGISGVLEELVSPEPKPQKAASRKQPPALPKKIDSGATSKPRVASSQRARLGRPPGNAGQATGPKEKVTLRIPSELIAEYRDWSWEARCQLSELVERALNDFRKSHHC